MRVHDVSNTNNNISNPKQQHIFNDKDDETKKEKESITKQPQKFINISIKDTGKGISKETISKIFTKFTSFSGGGMGLGLYISKNIVEAHGGKIWAENNEDKKGATFSVILPLINDSNIQNVKMN